MQFYQKTLMPLLAIFHTALVHSQNVGIGNTVAPSLLSVGTSSGFQVDESGNVVKINNVATSFPSVQGATGQVLINNGSGGLTWTNPATTAVFGDGSAGNFTVSSGQTVDLTTPTGVAQLPAGFNLNFNSITITGTLIVPSGTLLKATGTVNISGTITVATRTNIGTPAAGVAQSAAENYFGAVGISSFLAGSMVVAPAAAGGGGKRIFLGAGADGGHGGGGLTIYAKGNITLTTGANINANGASGVNPGTAGLSIVGTGGGAGGIVILAAGGNLTIAGTIRVQGGNGANGFNGNGGTGEGGGGGGGGGVVKLISSTSASFTGTVVTTGGSAGANDPGGTSVIPGGGGGACGGSGGNAGGTVPITTTIVNPSAGSAGYFLQVVVPSVEAQILGH